MLNKIRNFANTKSAGILVAILIVPFVLWGMGGLFSGGNKNNVAKINNQNISTQDFQVHLNSSKIELERIKKNINNNIIEEILAELISKKIMLMEVQDLNLVISDRMLNKRIKENKNFLNDDNKFSRIKYEKFLLSNNISAPVFEFNLKQGELKKNLFNYISGGVNSPLFLTNNSFKYQTKKLTINYVNLSNFYKKKEDFTNNNIAKFVEENEDALKEKLISFKYSKITPKNLIGLDEFNNLFFKKIDELENEISNGSTFENLLKKYNLELNVEENFKINKDDNSKEFYKKIYKSAEINKLVLLDENDYYILYEITNVQKILPNLKNENFITKIKEMLFNKSKFEFNSDLIKKIGEEKFTQIDFEKLTGKNLSTIQIDSIKDKKKFSTDSIKYLYTKSLNDFTLISDNDKNIYLIKIINISYKDITKKTKNFLQHKKQTDDKIKDTIFDTYNFFINKKYKVKINEKTLERVKNYFR
ncbi:MAG: SurA [Pelagibacteraceae bacterium]|nr:SurA [Pelagibacteraceae bacterium]